MEHANRMLEDLQNEEKIGYKAEINNVVAEDANPYNDDFEEDIEEELPEDNHLLESHGDGQ